MFTYPIFDVPIVREVNLARLRWPERGEAADESGLGGNRSYMDMRGISWATARTVLAYEADLISKIEAADDSDSYFEELGDEGDAGIDGIDLGVASTVFALSAARCVPFSSCNGGAFGDGHAEAHPVVAFFARPLIVKLLLLCAEESNCGLCSRNDFLLAYADDLRVMPRFASAIIRRSREFRAIRLRLVRP